MTRKDYKLISEVFKAQSDFNPSEKTKELFGLLATNLADRLKTDNPRFNTYIFLRACGIKDN